jgi:hypothetical protein
MKIFSYALLVLASAAVPLLAADTVELKQHWMVGKQYFFRAQTSQQSTITMGPQKMEQGVAMTMEMNVAVRSHEDGVRKRLTITYDRVAMDMTMNDQKMSYDSAKPEAGTDPLGMGKTLGATLGKELKILTNANDDIVEVENYDEYIKQITAAGVGGGMDMAKAFSREGLLQTMKQGSLQGLPAKPVAPGETWPFTNQITLPQIGTVKITGSYVFKGLVDHAGVRCAEIETDGAITMDLGGAPAGSGAAGLEALGMKVTEGKLTGPVWFDPQLGMARDAALVQEMTISMKNPADPTAALTVPMKQTIRTTLIKVEDLK